MNKRSRVVSVLWVVGALLMTFCGGRASVDPGSSESHFLGDCETTCGGMLQCICGVCTLPCDADETCTSVSSQASCLPAPSHHASCQGEASEQLCGIQCASDAECKQEHESLWCVEGQCRSVVSCAERRSVASERLARALTGADRSCNQDEDCTIVEEGTRCADGCGVILSQAGASALRALTESLDEGLCSTVGEGDCPTATTSCADPGIPACVDGQCTAQPDDSGATTLEQCVALLSSDDTSEAGACTRGCFAQEGCCFNSLSCGNGQFGEATGWTCSTLDAVECTVEGSAATTTGHTPLGTPSFVHAFNGMVALAGSRRVYLSSDPVEAFGCASHRLVLEANVAEPGSTSEVLVTEVDGDGRRALAVGTLTIDDVDAGVVSGSLDVTVDGWDLHVTFTAPNCSDFNIGP